jgi:hypothetical protein
MRRSCRMLVSCDKILKMSQTRFIGLRDSALHRWSRLSSLLMNSCLQCKLLPGMLPAQSH